MSKGQLYSPSFLVCHLSLSKENVAFFRPSLLNLYRYDAIQLQTNCYLSFYKFSKNILTSSNDDELLNVLITVAPF